MLATARGPLIALFALVLFGSPAGPRAQDAGGGGPDLLDLNSGALVLSYTNQYDSGRWSALSLLDGTNDTGWGNQKGKARFPFSFVIELAQRSRIETFVIDNRGTNERKFPGISTRRFELYVSTVSPRTGFRKVFSGEAARGERTTFELAPSGEAEPDDPSEFQQAAGVEAEWIRLVILSNWGHANYTTLMELEAYGKPLGAAPRRRSISGVYATNDDLMRLRHDGARVTGCYGRRGGTLNGGTDGRVIKFEWLQDNDFGSAIMVLSSRGDFLNGVWYHGNKFGGIWFGKRAKAGTSPKCKAPNETAVARAISKSGLAILYGIRFDRDKATLLPVSESTLVQVLNLMKNNKKMKLRVEGHTDSAGPVDYKLALSHRRARAVVAWLKAKGADASRLQPLGKGKREPVADNGSALGRALNRRVQITVME